MLLNECIKQLQLHHTRNLLHRKLLVVLSPAHIDSTGDINLSHVFSLQYPDHSIYLYPQRKEELSTRILLTKQDVGKFTTAPLLIVAMFDFCVISIQH